MGKSNETLFLSIIFLFVLQSISDFIESIYAFGLLQTSFTIEVASIVLFFSPLGLLFFRQGIQRPVLLTLALVGLTSHVTANLLWPGGKMLASGISMAALVLFLLAWLAHGQVRNGRTIGTGLALAILLSVLLRTLGSGSDVSLTNPLVGLALAGVAGWLLFTANLKAPTPTTSAVPTSFGRLTGLSVGVAGVFLMVYYGFGSPAVMARWTGFSYMAIVCTLAISLVLWIAQSGQAARLLTRRFVLGWNALFVLMLVLTILPHQVGLPAEPEAYPLEAGGSSPLAALPLLAVLALSPVMAVNLRLLVAEIHHQRPSVPQVGGAFTLASLYFLVMVFFHVFTTIYDYAPVIGPLFRDRFWLVYLLAGFGMGIPILLVGEKQFDTQPFNIAQPVVILAGALAVGSALAVLFTTPQPVEMSPRDELKIMTYNIQQGYAEDGKKNLAGQLEVIRQVAPDILGLQESDTARIANGNVDAVRYFTDQLEMYSYYGPTTTTGTFGIALLSKYPIENAYTFFMYSEGEQTATIHAQVRVQGRILNLFVTHLGNSGPIFQLENMLERVQGQENVIAMGDFNFRPPTEQYQLITNSLADAWLLRWPGGKQIPGYDPQRRIDHVFVSPRITILQAEYGLDPASDHPYLYVVIQL